MARAEIPVDLTNPGQVFACLGFVEAAHEVLGGATGGFDWQNSQKVVFHLEVPGKTDPVERVLQFLSEANVNSLAVSNSENKTDKWGIETVTQESGEFPYPDPNSPATLPACLVDRRGHRLVIDHWGDATYRRDNVKFWAGSGGYPGAALARDALDLAREQVMNYIDDPFSLATEQSSSFRFDWRRDYIPIDAGFSPNEHGGVVMQGYPLVELMAAIGLTNARPKRLDKLKYNYGAAGVIDAYLHDPIFLRAALGASKAPFPGLPFRAFTMQLGWPGQEGQARCITNVFEEHSYDQI